MVLEGDLDPPKGCWCFCAGSAPPSSMALRTRCLRQWAWPRRLLLIPLLVMLTVLLLMVAMLEPPPLPVHRDQHGAPHPGTGAQGTPAVTTTPHVWAMWAQSQQDQLEAMLLSPALPLREDELLTISTPRRGPGWDSRARRGRYKVVRQRQKQGSTLGDAALSPLQQEEATLGMSRGIRGPTEEAPVQRTLPEARHPLCLQQQYGTGLPTASIIICFHNEAWSVLLRTMHSALDTAPRELLKEIILVDDLSQPGPLKSALSEYITKLEGVKLMRSNKRLGAAGSRMLGAARATGQVLVFMDSHCECQAGWLEPLLSRIARDRHCIVSPVLDVIDRTSSQHRASNTKRWGTFDWELDFHWAAVPEEEDTAGHTSISPIRSPVVPGVVLAVDRHYFQNIGAYDPDLSMWGGENLELSLRVWLCGGSVEILPCSRVGHVHEDGTPGTSSDRQAAVRGKIRIAEAWLGSYKEIFYKHNVEAALMSRVKRGALSPQGTHHTCPGERV